MQSFFVSELMARLTAGAVQLSPFHEQTVDAADVSPFR